MIRLRRLMGGGTRAPALRSDMGLVLSGGGARTAYQIGVLMALVELLPRDAPSPFKVISGSSAGAINATSLALGAAAMRPAVVRLHNLWRNLETNKVFRSDFRGIYGKGLHWLVALGVGGLGKRNPRSLLDNSPLHALLKTHLDFARLRRNIAEGHLRGLSITASSYTSGRSVSYFQAAEDIPAWERSLRMGVPVDLSLRHVMASIAIPMLFPAIRVDNEYYGDGSMREVAPFSPAIHLGARHILAIGTRPDIPEELTEEHQARNEKAVYPSLGDIGGYMLETLFLDSYEADLERIKRINQTLSHMPGRARRQLVGKEGQSRPLKEVDALILAPSRDLREIAFAHRKRFPWPVRHLLRGIGAFRESSPLPSYLLFDGEYCRTLLELGYRDGCDQHETLRKFLFEE